MKKDNVVYLQHILDSIVQIREYTKGLSEKDFLKDKKVQDAVLRRLEIIGEAIKNLSEDLRIKHNDVEWNKAVATRNILIHHYFDVDLQIVWDTLKLNLPGLEKQVRKLMK